MKKSILKCQVWLAVSVIIMILLGVVTLLSFGEENKVLAEEASPFIMEEERIDGVHIIRYKNLSSYQIECENQSRSRGVETNNRVSKREISLLHKIGFTDDEIRDMSSETVLLYTTTNYLEQRIVEYEVNENNEIMPLNSSESTYNKLKIINTLAANGKRGDDNSYVASMKVLWTSKPANQLTDFMYIACGNGITVNNSTYSECRLSYTNRIIVPGIGTTYTYPKYSNDDGSGKIVPYNNNFDGDGWKINVPFMPTYNQYHYDITFFMQAEVVIKPNTLGKVYYSYFHQKIVGSPSFGISSSGASISFTKNYTLDLFSGRTFAIMSNGDIE